MKFPHFVVKSQVFVVYLRVCEENCGAWLNSLVQVCYR